MVNNIFLLDTHIFIWAMEKNKRLPKDIKEKIEDPQNKIYISVATMWEIVIKKMAKKLKFNFDLKHSVEDAGMDLLPIQLNHVLAILQLPLYHNDPFDRLLTAQAKSQNLTLITSDEKIWKYSASLIKVR